MRLSTSLAASLASLALRATSPPPGTVTALPVAHSPLFDAARELLRKGADESAAVWQLYTEVPELTLPQCRQILRAAAVILHASGERHDT